MIELIKENQSIEIIEKDTEVKLLSTMLKGEDGGYYTPKLEEGILSWKPSQPDMPPVEDSNLNIEVDVDLTGYATEQYVDDAIKNITDVDVAGFATEEYVNNAVAAEETERAKADAALDTKINNITKEYKATDAAIQKALDNEIDRAIKAEGTNAEAIAALQLADTALQANIDAEAKTRADTIAAIKAECNAENDDIREVIGAEQERAIAAENELKSGIEAEAANRDKAISAAIAAIPATDLTPYAKKTDIPTKVSAFENDKGYLTEHQSLQGYATEAFVTSAIGAIPETDLTGYAKESYVDEKVASVIDTAPEALNTLNELSAALGDDPNFATTVSTEIGKKVDKTDLATVATSGSYNDLSNKPTIPSAYTHPASHPASMITGLADVATSGDYKDLSNTPEEYTHPANHPASMITGLATVATSGKYSDLSGLPTIPAAYTHPTTHPATMITGLSTVATTGNYSDLTGTPSIPAAYTHPATHPASMITGLATVATSGSYNDLSNKPTIPAAYTHPSTHPASMITGLHSVATDGNAAKVGGKQIVVASSAPTTNDTSIITFVI